MNDEQWQNKRNRFLEDAARSWTPADEVASATSPLRVAVAGDSPARRAGRPGKGQRSGTAPDRQDNGRQQ